MLIKKLRLMSTKQVNVLSQRNDKGTLCANQFPSVNLRTVVYNIDLLQVDLLASGASLFWPRSGRPRATKSREVAPYEIRRRIFLKVYI